MSLFMKNQSLWKRKKNESFNSYCHRVGSVPYPIDIIPELTYQSVAAIQEKAQSSNSHEISNNPEKAKEGLCRRVSKIYDLLKK